MAVDGWRNHVGEGEYSKIKGLATRDMPRVGVTLDWQADGNSDQEERLRDVLGTIFKLKEIGGRPVYPIPENDVPQLFKSTITWMNSSGRRLWLDYGSRDRVIGEPSDPGGARVISDLKTYYEFRVRPEGKPVGVNEHAKSLC